MVKEYIQNINLKEQHPFLNSLRTYAKDHNVPVITEEGIRFLNQLIKIKQAISILEIGSAIAYSSIHMAINNPNVQITTIERNEEMIKLAKENIKQANLENRITLIEQDALLVDETSLGMFDIIFIDAAKSQSIKFFNKYKTVLKDKGLIITDNLLFHDLVVAEIKDRNLKQLVGKIDKFNQFVVREEEFDTTIYSIGDGMSVSIKK
jgi:predicted O-methyltransferase YrrM